MLGDSSFQMPTSTAGEWIYRLRLIWRESALNLLPEFLKLLWFILGRQSLQCQGIWRAACNCLVASSPLKGKVRWNGWWTGDSSSNCAIYFDEPSWLPVVEQHCFELFQVISLKKSLDKILWVRSNNVLIKPRLHRIIAKLLNGRIVPTKFSYDRSFGLMTQWVVG